MTGGGDAPDDLLDISAEVAAALAAGRPVVALETTLVSHGFPGMRGLDPRIGFGINAILWFFRFVKIIELGNPA